MDHTLLFGTDLHGKPTELASKTVQKLHKKIPKSTIISLENIKNRISQNKVCIIPKLSKKRSIRITFQAFILPFYFLYFRMRGYKKIFSFWTVHKSYHSHLFAFLSFIGFRIYFTVISGYDKDYSSLKYCEKIICQSKRMKDFLSKEYGNKLILIAPGIDVATFKPTKKENLLIIFSVPYDPNDAHLRGIDKLLKTLKSNPKIKAEVICRSKNSADSIRSMNLENLSVHDNALSDKELSKISNKAKVMPLIYKECPDMTLSGIEAMASGCSIICLNNIGLADYITEGNGGFVLEEFSEEKFLNCLNKIYSDRSYNQRARKTALKYFDLKKNLEEYCMLLN